MTAARKIKILLINAINTFAEQDSRYPSLGLAYLAAAARQYLPDIDFNFKIVNDHVHSFAKEFKPDLVGISSVSKNFNIACTYANDLSVLGIPVVIGGVHISLVPESLPSSATVGCIGEGEYTFVDLLRVFINKKTLRPEDLTTISGIIYWDNGILRKNAGRRPEEHLDNIPVPARDLLKIEKHAHMVTSRGCPYQCVYCSSSAFWKRSRFFSAEYVAHEIELLYHNHHVDLISFLDDLFTADRSRIEQMCSLLDKKNLLGKVRFTCTCRANLVDQSLINVLKRLGVVNLEFGFESGNDEVLKLLKVGNASVAQNAEAIKLAKATGMCASGNFIIGAPNETQSQILQTYQFIKNNDMDIFNVYLLTPYPGTLVWADAKDRNIVSEKNFDWSRLDLNIHHTPADQLVIVSKTLTRKELLSLYQKFSFLRFRRIISKILHHPLRRDVPEMAFKMSIDYIYHLFYKLLIKSLGKFSAGTRRPFHPAQPQ